MNILFCLCNTFWLLWKGEKYDVELLGFYSSDYAVPGSRNIIFSWVSMTTKKLHLGVQAYLHVGDCFKVVGTLRWKGTLFFFLSLTHVIKWRNKTAIFPLGVPRYDVASKRERSVPVQLCIPTDIDTIQGETGAWTNKFRFRTCLADPGLIFLCK